MEEVSRTGGTAGIKKVQTKLSVINGGTESVMLQRIMQVNTPVQEQRQEAHVPHTPVMLLYWLYQASNTHQNKLGRGETVNVICNIVNGGGVQNWSYSWNKGGSDVCNGQYYRIWDVTVADAGKYTCTGTETGGSRSSHPSDAVLLTVSAKPKPTVRLEPQNFIYTGDTVTLTCDLNQSTGWTFIWYRNDQEVNPQISADKITTNKLSEKLSNTGTTKYKCRAQRVNYYYNYKHNYDSDYSDPVTVTVEEKPKPAVRLEPQNFIYTGDTVTLTCDLDQSTGWTFIWYRNDQEVNPQISADKITTNKLSEKLSNTGTTEYTCRAQRFTYYYSYSQYSDPVTVTVEERPKAAVIINPDNHVFIGEIVTHTCNIENGGGVQNWSYSWNKVGSDQTVSNYQQYRISDVTENHAGKYTCTGTETGGSRSSHPSDAVLLTVSERPKAAVIINPDNHVFIGETVTLTCNIENRGGVQNWSYSWNKEGSDQTVSNGQQYRISDVTENHAGKYTCTGTETGGSRSSHPSDAVLLTVSAKPKPTMRLEPQNFIYTGDTVTLTCDLNQSTGWTFIWYRNDQEVNPQISAAKITTNKLSEKLYYTGTTKYKCRARRENYYYNKYYYDSLYSDPVTVTVEERPKAAVIINPDNHVFIGEIVTLTCNIENGGGVQNWSYSWNKEGSDQTVSNGQQYRISDVTENHAGKYTCTGTETGGSHSSHPSDAVLLTVSERPKAAVIINPDNHVFVGEIVTLTCNIVNGGEKAKPELTSNHKVAALAGNLVLLYCELNPTAGWNFYWYKHTQNTETETTTHPSYTIYSVSVSDGGQYWCRAGRGNPVYYTDYSNALWVNVTGESSSVSLIISPSRTQHFTDESLSLSCVDQSKSTEWRVRRYTDHQGVLDCSAVSGTDGESTWSISSLNTSHTGVYWCESESGGSSNPVNIIVHGGDVILESPVHPVTEGEALILHCLYRKTKPSNLRADFFKDGSVVQNQTREMMIHQVSKSDEGFYHCKYPEGGESPKSWVIIRVCVSLLAAPHTRGRPKAAVIINPDNHVFIGETVTFTCNIENGGRVQNWRYSWNKEGSDQTVSNGQQYRISDVTENHAGKYTCTGTETGGSRSSHPSDAVILTVSGESSSVSLIISPSRTQHFTDESLSLSCVDQSKSTEWRVRRYTDDRGVLDCSAVSGTDGESTCNISSLRTSHAGVYWCESESGGSSNPVNITVHDGDVILESPVHSVTEGESLTLHCLYRKTKPSNLRADFYKDGSVVQNQTSGEMMIHHVSKSDEGFYHCKYPEGGESPKSWVIIRGDKDSLLSVSKSVATIIGVAVGLSSALLLLVLMILLWRYKKNKVSCEKKQVATAQMLKGDVLDTAIELSNVTYAEVDLKPKKKSKDAVKDFLYSEITLTNLKTPIKGAAAEPSDTTYTEIDLKPKKKPRKSEGKISVGADTVYSELK
ncbi:basement membrane-specific heparan sulfate proteoglycan core protein-like [Trichomycterus rosablanca]|uniref:basement membrane-specific heparan sulfate proteoglycan core protein-like n=1 Tax=Trichomycterus rosablanca TaxID=2290929 RepID=UPI002F34F94C